MRPDWVMVGVPLDDDTGRVWILASRTLSVVQLRSIVNEPAFVSAFDSYLWDAPRIKRYDLTASMSDVVFTVGRDYGEALATLLKHWSPSGAAPAQPEVGAGLLAIEAGA